LGKYLETPVWQISVLDSERRHFFKVKEIKGLRGGVLLYAVQAKPKIGAEIGKNGSFWTKTR